MAVECPPPVPPKQYPEHARSDLDAYRRRSVQPLAIDTFSSNNEKHASQQTQVTIRPADELASPPLTPRTSAAKTTPEPAHQWDDLPVNQVYGPLSSHPPLSWKQSNSSVGLNGPLTPPTSHKGSVETTPVLDDLTAIPSLPQAPDLSIPTPIDSIPRTHITKPAVSNTAEEPRPWSKRLHRRNSISTRSILSLAGFRSSIVPTQSQLQSTAQQHPHLVLGSAINASSGASISSQIRRPATANSRSPAANMFCLPVPNTNQALFTLDGRPLSQTGSPSETNLSYQGRKSKDWFRRPSSIFMRTGNDHASASSPMTAMTVTTTNTNTNTDHDIHYTPSIVTPDSCSMQCTPTLSFDTHSVTQHSQSEGRTSTDTDAMPESAFSSSSVRVLQEAPCLPPVGTLQDGVLTGGDIGGDSIFDCVCRGHETVA